MFIKSHSLNDKHIIKLMCHQDHTLKPKHCSMIIKIFKKTLVYFMLHHEFLRIKGFITLKRHMIKASKVKSFSTGAEYDRPNFYTVRMKIDRILKDFLNRRRTSEKIGEPINIPQEIINEQV